MDKIVSLFKKHNRAEEWLLDRAYSACIVCAYDFDVYIKPTFNLYNDNAPFKAQICIECLVALNEEATSRAVKDCIQLNTDIRENEIDGGQD